VHTGKELEAHYVEKGDLSCDSDLPQVGSTRSDSTRVVKVNRRKTRPYCTTISRIMKPFMGTCLIKKEH